MTARTSTRFPRTAHRLYATVQHTGTRETAESILGYVLCPIEERHRARPNDVLFAHLHTELMELVMAHEGPVITLSRPYADVEASWIRRGESLDLLREQWSNYQRLLTRRPYILTLGDL